MKIGTLFLPLIGPFIILLEILQVTGMSMTAMWLSLLRLGLIQLPLLIVGAEYFGVTGVWLALCLTDFLAAAFLPGFLRIFWNHLYPAYTQKRKKRGMVYTLHRLKYWLRF